MPLLGHAAIVILSDVTDTAAHDDWHTHEHLLERLAIPGFLRGRRMAALDGQPPQYLVLYEVADVSVTVSAAYLERLNHPTPWSQRIMAEHRALTRTLCLCAASQGHGVGGHLLLLRFDAPDAALRTHLAESVLPGLVHARGISGAHLLLRDLGTERPPTEEERLRGGRDASVDAMLIVEGYDAAALQAAAPVLAAHWEQRGLPPPVHRQYGLAQVMTPQDLLPPTRARA